MNFLQSLIQSIVQSAIARARERVIVAQTLDEMAPRSESLFASQFSFQRQDWITMGLHSLGGEI